MFDRKGYKVVRNKNQSLYSVVVPYYDTACVKYKKGNKIFPNEKCGPLLLFSNYKAAENFALQEY